MWWWRAYVHQCFVLNMMWIYVSHFPVISTRKYLTGGFWDCWVYSNTLEFARNFTMQADLHTQAKLSVTIHFRPTNMHSWHMEVEDLQTINLESFKHISSYCLWSSWIELVGWVNNEALDFFRWCFFTGLLVGWLVVGCLLALFLLCFVPLLLCSSFAFPLLLPCY